MALERLDARLGGAIAGAADEVLAGSLRDQFVVDVYQAGAGTSHNMNVNEVLANRAAERLGGVRGEYRLVHPNDHVNMGQSTNDVFPTAIHVAALEAVEHELLPALGVLAEAFEQKAAEFADVVKAGRTHLQDAVPITLGQEFSGYASVIRHDIRRVEACRPHLAELPLGGTALGTGINADPRFAPHAIAELNRRTGLAFRRAENPFEAMQNRDAAVETSGALRVLAVGLMKIANDLRLLTSGSRTGLNEIELPATQPGSSIMPGKVNPVIAEAVNMVAAQLVGYDAAIAIAAMNGNLDLNVMMPVIAYDLIESIELAASASKVFAEKCVRGIRANVERCREYAELTGQLVTAVAPVIGYDKAAQVYKKAVERNVSIREIILEEGLIPRDKLDQILDLKKLTQGGRA
jgi:fumarate hydratase class II